MASNRAGCLLLVNDTFVLQYEVDKPLTCRSRFGDGGADAAMTPRYKISNPKDPAPAFRSSLLSLIMTRNNPAR